MNKLNNSFKIFFDNIVKPFIKKENSRNYKMEFVDGSSNLFKTSVIRSYKSNMYKDNDCNFKIMNENKTLLDGKLTGSYLNKISTINKENNYTKIKEMDNSFNYGYSFVVNNLCISYDYNPNPKTTIQVVDDNYNVVIDKLEIPDIALIQYIGETGTAGYGFDDFNYLAFQARQKLDDGTYQTKIVFVNKKKLISNNAENITQAFEERKEYIITNENLGETYSSYDFDNSFLMRGNYINTSYAHGVLYILRGICTGLNSFKERRLVAIVVDFALNDDRTDVNVAITERVLDEIPNFNSNPLIAISNTEAYINRKVGKVSLFLGNKIYISEMPNTFNTLTQTTEVPTFTEHETNIEGNFSGIADFGNKQGVVYYLVTDSAQNVYKYTTESSNLALIKKADEVKKYFPRDNFSLEGISSFNVGNDTYVTVGGYISKDLCVWFPFYNLKKFINGKYIDGESVYECNNIDKLLAIQSTTINDIKAKVAFVQNYYSEITQKYTIFYTQHSISNVSSINFVLEDNNKYYINK